MVCCAAGHPGVRATSCTARYPAALRTPRRAPPRARAVSGSTCSALVLLAGAMSARTIPQVRSVVRARTTPYGRSRCLPTGCAIVGDRARRPAAGRARPRSGRTMTRERRKERAVAARPETRPGTPAEDAPEPGLHDDRSVAATLGQSKLIRAGLADVSRVRERTRRRRLLRLAIVLAAIDAFLWYRVAIGDPLGPPSLPDDAMIWLPGILLIGVLALVLLLPMGSGRSPHVLIRPEHLEVGLEDVRGLDGQIDEVVRSLNVFLGYSTFRDRLGGNPRRGILFEGPPGTGKTYLARAMAKQAGVPFLFVSAPAFQSMWFGMTGARIRSFFKALRKAARREGGAIGFIEEIDAIGSERGGGVSASPWDGPRSVARMMSPSVGGMVNELLIQMQSFDQPTWIHRIRDRLAEWVNGYLPSGRRLRTRTPAYHNILLIAATNRGDVLDPALMRPGRFDRRLYFDLPTKQGRRDLVEYFLGTTRRLEVLSIIKRRQSLGLLAHADLEERFTKSRSELEASVAIALAGMAAEEEFIGESGTGPASDLSAATEVAAAMVGALGMAGSLVSYEAVNDGPVSMTNLVGKVLGDGDGKRRVEELLDRQKERAREVLRDNRDVVEALRDSLMARDELVGEEITKVIVEALERRRTVVLPEPPAERASAEAPSERASP